METLQDHTERFVVCVKQVPDTQEIRVDEQTGTLIRDGVPSILNPFDEYALNLAISVRDKFCSEAEIIALSMGPAQAAEALKKCLAIGADSAILLSDRAFAGADTYATSNTIARAVQKIGSFSLVFCGYEALDGNTAQVGPEIAQILGVPFICYAESVEQLNEKEIVCKRESEEGYEIIRAPMPALITCMTPANFEPKLPGVREIMAARRKSTITWDMSALGGSREEYGLRGSLTRVTKTYTPERKRSGVRLESPSMVSDLIKALKEGGLL